MARPAMGVASLAGLGFAGEAGAAPMTFVVQSGQIRVEASCGAQILGLSDVAGAWRS